MSAADYQPPVAHLLSYGRPKVASPAQWFDYVAAYGFTDEHIPDLIRLASETDLNWEDDVECYAFIHAYRALGQLKAEAAIQPLIQLLDNEEIDWFMEDLPKVFSLIGPVCIPALTDYLNQHDHTCWSKAAAANGLNQIAQSHSAHRDECVHILIEALSNHQQNPPELNGCLVAKLLDLQATAAASVIEKAYKEGPMDEMVCGTWATVQIELGLATAADFTPEELRFTPPEWMQPLQQIAERIQASAPPGEIPHGPASTKADSAEFQLKSFGTGVLSPKKSKSAQPKSGFGSQRPKAKQKKRKR